VSPDSLPGTARFAARFPLQQAAGFYRIVQGLTVSNIGIGTYLGEVDEATDRAYVEALRGALEGGVNFIDTSLNYRNQRSERCIGIALKQVPRDEMVICSKAGYLVPDAVPAGLAAGDIVGGMHSLAPAFLRDQLERSRGNLGIDSIDVFYLHNPETQLAYIGEPEFLARIRQAFECLEQLAAEGAIRFYGTATWQGFRHRQPSPEALSLERLEAIASETAGNAHHFRFIQLPFNLAMPEAFVHRVNGESVLQIAERLGITVVASASLYQGRLSRNLPDEIRAKIPGPQPAIQFVRSTPGISVALVGMSRLAHVRENLGLASVPPLALDEYLSLYAQS
jgi:aryl-alcohol dehydrogenase-like predicted oxidoreductase